MFIVFDIETNGLPKDRFSPAEKVDNFPRVIQLAYNLYDEQAKLIKKVCKLIKPEGWSIPNESFWINNGFSQEKSLEEGVPLKEVLEEFVQDRLKANYSIAHNIGFDSKILRSEMIRASMLNIEFKSKKVCTMTSTTKYCQIPSKNGKKGFKWPTMAELYFKLFNAHFIGGHDAGADVEACAKCFFELLRLKVIKLD